MGERETERERERRGERGAIIRSVRGGLAGAVRLKLQQTSTSAAPIKHTHTHTTPRLSKSTYVELSEERHVTSSLIKASSLDQLQ